MKPRNDALVASNSCHDAQNHFFIRHTVMLMLIFVVTPAIYSGFTRTSDLMLTAAYWKLETSSVSIRYSGNIARRLRKVSIQSNTGDPL